MRNAAVIQAAGQGSRFHSEQYKLLALVEGQPMILRTLAPVLDAGFDEVVVVIGSHADAMRQILVNYPVIIVENPRWMKGQSTSLSAGIRAVMDSSDRACLLLGDQPYLQTETLQSLLKTSDRFPGEIIVPELHGRRGNPIIVPASRYEMLLEQTSGDMGGRKLLEKAGYHPMPTDDSGVIRDIDKVDDLGDYDRAKFLEN